MTFFSTAMCPESWGSLLPDGGCGEDISLEPEFEELQAEVDRENSIHADSPTDWKQVLELVEPAMALSRDVWIYCYASAAMYQVHGLAAGAETLAILGELLDQAWDRVYPTASRPQRRMAPFKWLTEKLTVYAKSGFVSESPENVRALQAALRRIQDILDEKFPDNDVILLSALGEVSILREEETVHAPPEDISRTPDPNVFVLPPTSDDGNAAIPPHALSQVMRAAVDSARRLGDHFLALDILDPRGYELHRAACWSTIQQCPSAGSDGTTEMNCSVHRDTVDMYKSAVAFRKFAEILPQLERSASKAPFWLDGHYMVARCLEGLRATPALQSLNQACRSFLGHFPQVAEYRFKDGKPFADPDTRRWLESLTEPEMREVPPTPATVSEEAASAEGRLDKALDVAAEDGVDAALASLGPMPPSPCRLWVQESILRARLCLLTGKRAAGLSILETVVVKLRALGLLEWEPELSTEAVRLLMTSRGRKARDGDEELRALLHLHTKDSVSLFPDS